MPQEKEQGRGSALSRPRRPRSGTVVFFLGGGFFLFSVVDFQGNKLGVKPARLSPAPGRRLRGKRSAKYRPQTAGTAGVNQGGGRNFIPVKRALRLNSGLALFELEQSFDGQFAPVSIPFPGSYDYQTFQRPENTIPETSAPYK